MSDNADAYRSGSDELPKWPKEPEYSDLPSLALAQLIAHGNETRNAALARLRVAVEALQLIADSSPADDMDGAPDCAREALRRIGPLPGEKP